MKHIASVSWGKDSLAMLLLLLEGNYPLDEVVFYDTGMEFNAIYKNRDKVLPILKALKIKYTELKPKESFLYTMLKKPVKKRDGTLQNGYSWCGGRCRWGTTEKLRALENHCKSHFEYVGLAIDEPKRLAKERKGHKLFPLVDFGMTEEACLNHCRQMGYNWKEGDIDLYEILKRVSCWNCGNKNLKELKNYYLHLPEYWERLKALQRETNRPFKKGVTIIDLEERFKKEVSNVGSD